MELLGYRWNYINEGNIHIVLQLLGTEYVLRLIKEDDNAVDIKNVEYSANFVNLIMVPLLSGNAYNSQEIINIPQGDLNQFVKVLHDLRPENRRIKSKLSQFAIKTQNLALLSHKCKNNYCVEIKPKEGFISTNLEGFGKCYYCLKQHLKLVQNEIQEKSKYCPLDLFSGNRQRMKRAIISLINNPQNNFKLFKNGKVIYNEKSQDKEFNNIVKNIGIFEKTKIFIDFIIEILLNGDTETKTLEETQELSNPQADKCSENSNSSPQDCILYKLLQIQKVSEKEEVKLTQTQAEKNINYVQELLDHIQSQKLDLKLLSDQKTCFKTANRITVGLISAVAKDCSIMISFSSEYITGYKHIQIGDKIIPYKVSITDLEPKYVQSLVKRNKTENKAIEAYKKYLNKEMEEKSSPKQKQELNN